MAKIVEQALGGEYTVTVQPYPDDHRRHEGGDGWRWRDRLHRRHRHDRVLCRRSGGFKDYKPDKPEIVHTWYAYPMESLMATTAKEAGKFKCWKDFSGKPVFFTPAGFMNWLNFQRIFKALGSTSSTSRSIRRPTPTR